MDRMFGFVSALTSIDVSSFDTSNVINMGYMFDGCYDLISIDISNFDTQNVEDMSGMFYGCVVWTKLIYPNLTLKM